MFIKTKKHQLGSVLIESAIALPILLTTIFASGSLFFKAMKVNYVNKEMLSTVREVTLSQGGNCSELAENTLRTKLMNENSTPSVSVHSTVNGDFVDIQIAVDLDAHGVTPDSSTNSGLIQKTFRVKLENPDKCYVS